MGDHVASHHDEAYAQRGVDGYVYNDMLGGVDIQMSPRTESYVLVAGLAYLFVINMFVTFSPTIEIPSSIRTLTCFFAAILIVDIALVLVDIVSNHNEE